MTPSTPDQKGTRELGPWQTIALYVLVAIVMTVLILGLAALIDVGIHGWPS